MGLRTAKIGCATRRRGPDMITGRVSRLKGLLLIGCVIACLGLPAMSVAQWKAKDTEWASYAADLAGTRYRPLEQINAANFNELEIAWRIKTDNFGNRPEYKLEGTPLMVGGVLYATAGSRRAAIALKQNDDQEILPDLVTGEIGIQSAPVVAKNTIIIGAAFREGMTPKSMRNNKGYVRGFDVRTGKRLWIFHTIPKKGEFGYDTWLNGSAEYTGNTGVWSQVTADEELGLAYLPVESPTNDFYGGHRAGKQ